VTFRYQPKNIKTLHNWLMVDRPFGKTSTNESQTRTGTYPRRIVDFDKLSDWTTIKRRQQATGGRQQL